MTVEGTKHGAIEDHIFNVQEIHILLAPTDLLVLDFKGGMEKTLFQYDNGYILWC